MRFVSKLTGALFTALVMSQSAVAVEQLTLAESKQIAEDLRQGAATGYADIEIQGRCRIQINSKEHAYVSDAQECFESLEHVLMNFHMANLPEYEALIVEFREQYGY